jgi:exodeoxyribonuclease VII small subunit
MQKKRFEEELEHSRRIVERLMDPEITLEESVKLYEEGMQSVKRARRMIEDARNKVEKISRDAESEE